MTDQDPNSGRTVLDETAKTGLLCSGVDPAKAGEDKAVFVYYGPMRICACGAAMLFPSGRCKACGRQRTKVTHVTVISKEGPA